MSVARSTSGAWGSVINAAYAIRNKAPTSAVCGPDLFGLTCPEVALRIQRLEGAKSCFKYKWQKFISPDGHEITDDMPIA